LSTPNRCIKILDEDFEKFTQEDMGKLCEKYGVPFQGELEAMKLNFKARAMEERKKAVSYSHPFGIFVRLGPCTATKNLFRTSLLLIPQSSRLVRRFVEL